MAEIKVERRRPSVWPWVIGLLILALLVWGLTELLSDGTEPVIPETADSLSAPDPQPAPFPESATPPAATAPGDTAGSSAADPDSAEVTADTAR